MKVNTPSHFPVLVMPVGTQCNMHCTYCFREGLDRRQIMQPNVRSELIRAYRRASPRHPAVIFQGGEPLLAGLRWFQEFVAEAGGDFQYMLQTNGILLDKKWCQFLKKANFMVSLSYDGFFGPRGKGERRALHAIDLLRQHEVRYSISAVVSKESVRHPVPIIDDLGIRCREVQFIPARPMNSEQFHSGDFPSGEGITSFYRAVGERMADKSKPRVRNFDDAFGSWIGSPLLCESCAPGHPGGCGGHLVIDDIGDVYSCDFWLGHPGARAGNIMETDIREIFEGEVMSELRELKGLETVACEKCDVRESCNRGCPHARWLAGGAGPEIKGPAAALDPYCAARYFLASNYKPQIGDPAGPPPEG